MEQITESVEDVDGNSYIQAYIRYRNDDLWDVWFKSYHTFICYPFTQIWGGIAVPFLKKFRVGRVALCHLTYSPGFVFLLNIDAAIFGIVVYGTFLELARRLYEVYLTK